MKYRKHALRAPSPPVNVFGAASRVSPSPRDAGVGRGEVLRWPSSPQPSPPATGREGVLRIAKHIPPSGGEGWEGEVHGKRTPPNLDVSWDYEPEMHKSFKIKRPILRFMERFVFRSDLLTGHEPASRWDRRHPCRRVACGLPRRQGCRRSQVHGKVRVPFEPAHGP